MAISGGSAWQQGYRAAPGRRLDRPPGLEQPRIASRRGDQQALEYVKRLRKDFQIKIAEDRL